jgi:hypothetical protein
MTLSNPGHKGSGSTIVTSNRPFDDWSKLLGDVVVVAPLLDRLMHHGHLLKFEGKSWRLKEAAARQVGNMAAGEPKRSGTKNQTAEAA